MNAAIDTDLAVPDAVIFDIRDFGAVAGDGKDDAAAIQAAIDAARDHGEGARVVIHDGEYLSNSALYLYDNSYLHLDESAILLKGYVSGAANAFIRTEPVPRGLTDAENDISNGLKFADSVTITGSGRIEMASKALDGTGSYGPVLQIAGNGWTVSDITIDGYYSTPKLDADGNLVLSDRPEKDYLIVPNKNAIAIQVVGDDHVLSDLQLLDGSHSYGTTGIRVFSGSNIYITDTYIESGDDMIAVAPVQKYTSTNGTYALNTSPVNQGDVKGVHFNNITGYSTAARIFAAIDSHPTRDDDVWGNHVTDITLTNIDATTYKSNQALAILNYLGHDDVVAADEIVATNGLLSGFSIVDSTLRMTPLPDGLIDYIPETGTYTNARGVLIQDVPDVYLENVTIAGADEDIDFTGIEGTTDISLDNPTIGRLYIDTNSSLAYSDIEGRTSGRQADADAARQAIFLHQRFVGGD